MVRAYILINTEVGKMREVVESLRKLKSVKDTDMLTGPYDIIVHAEAENISTLRDEVVEKIRGTDGVKKTTTNIVM